MQEMQNHVSWIHWATIISKALSGTAAAPKGRLRANKMGIPRERCFSAEVPPVPQSVYIYTYTCLYVYIYIYIYTCIYVYMCIYIYIHTYIRTYVRTYIHTYIHTYVSRPLRWREVCLLVWWVKLSNISLGTKKQGWTSQSRLCPKRQEMKCALFAQSTRIRGLITFLSPVAARGGFLKWGYPEIIHFNGIFHYKPSILGYLHVWNPHMGCQKMAEWPSLGCRWPSWGGLLQVQTNFTDQHLKLGRWAAASEGWTASLLWSSVCWEIVMTFSLTLTAPNIFLLWPPWKLTGKIPGSWAFGPPNFTFSFSRVNICELISQDQNQVGYGCWT